MKIRMNPFNPGQAPGPVVAMDRAIMPKAGFVVQPQKPEATRKQVPWVTCVRGNVGNTRTPAAAGTILQFVRSTGDPAFFNFTNGVVEIDEMRIASAYVGFAGAQGETLPRRDSNRSLGVRMTYPGATYVDNWLPVGYLNNQVNRFSKTPWFNGAYTLEKPFFVDMKNPFRLRIRQSYQSSYQSDLEIWFGMYGMGSDGFPIHAVKKVTIPYRATFNGPYYYEVLFDDDRDRLVRDATITHVGFSFGPLDITDMRDQSQAPHVVLSTLELQFRPANGPLWMREDDWVPLWMVQDQPGMLWDLQGDTPDFSHMIHRFESPIVLQPREEVTVALNVLERINVGGAVESGYYGEDDPIWCAFYGRQEVVQ